MSNLSAYKRLSGIFSVTPKSHLIMDIGCDHGYLAHALLEQNIAQNIIACDISEGSLSKAMLLFADNPRAQCILMDGEKAISRLGENDKTHTAVICGMGGREIIKILGGLKKAGKQYLVLQPQRNADCVRRYLSENGHEITHDFVVEENFKFYDIIVAVAFSQPEQLSLEQLAYGKFYKMYQTALLKKIKQERQCLLTYKQTQQNEKRLKILAEVEKWQKK